MNVEDLPEDEELRLGAVRLPAGHHVMSGDESGPVAWVTHNPVPDAGRIWQSLSATMPEIGLQPVLFGGEYAEYLFDWPADVTDLAGLAAADVLEQLWNERTGGFPERFEPFTERFPGLASAVTEPAAASRIDAALGSLGARLFGLVQARRPADVLPVIGYHPQLFDDPLPPAAVLRSWESRFGAKLLQLGPSDEIRLLVERPPRTPESGLALAAEHWAFSGAWINEGHGERIDLTTVSDIATHILDSPIWGFWWD